MTQSKTLRVLSAGLLAAGLGMSVQAQTSQTTPNANTEAGLPAATNAGPNANPANAAVKVPGDGNGTSRVNNQGLGRAEAKVNSNTTAGQPAATHAGAGANAANGGVKVYVEGSNTPRVSNKGLGREAARADSNANAGVPAAAGPGSTRTQ